MDLLERLVYAVPVVDVTWASFGPLNLKKNYSAGPLPLDLCLEEAKGMLELMRRSVDSRFVICPQSSLWAVETFCREPFMAIWKRALARGAEF